MTIENVQKTSHSYKFTRFLIRICVLPIEDGNTMNELRFKFLSWRTMSHIAVYFGITIMFLLLQNLYPYENDGGNKLETIVGYSNLFVGIAVTFPLLLVWRMNGFTKKIILNPNSRWPEVAWKHILAIVLIFSGGVIWGACFYSLINAASKQKWFLIIIQCLAQFYYCLLWTLPVSLVGIWIENLVTACKGGENDVIQHTKFCLSSYRNLSRNFGWLFVIYFGVIQILFVTWTFLRDLSFQSRKIKEEINKSYSQTLAE